MAYCVSLFKESRQVIKEQYPCKLSETVFQTRLDLGFLEETYVDLCYLFATLLIGEYFLLFSWQQSCPQKLCCENTKEAHLFQYIQSTAVIWKFKIKRTQLSVKEDSQSSPLHGGTYISCDKNGLIVRAQFFCFSPLGIQRTAAQNPLEFHQIRVVSLIFFKSV